MANLLTETLEVMTGYKLLPEQILYIGDGDSSCSWEEYTVIADTTYDHGYGCNEIKSDLIIVFDTGVEFHRGEYDGSEWWDVYTPFSLKGLKQQTKLTDVKSGW